MDDAVYDLLQDHRDRIEGALHMSLVSLARGDQSAVEQLTTPIMEVTGDQLVADDMHLQFDSAVSFTGTCSALVWV
jgi:hypothetical protein